MRDATPYATRRDDYRAPEGYGFNPDKPVAGFYSIKLRRDGPPVAIRVWFGPPLDPVTGEELDRGWRWQVQTDGGDMLDVERVWPACARSPITEGQFKHMAGLRSWAKTEAPDSPLANPAAKSDPLHNPLPF